MDLIYTDARRIDQGVIPTYAFDLSYGAEENDYEITIGADDVTLESGAVIYIEGTDYGGIVDGLKASTNGATVTYMGRTWHGIMNSKIIQPDSGADYYVVSGEANSVLSALVSRLKLWSLFSVSQSDSGVNISRYQFNRFCKGYDGIRAMLAANGAKLKIRWENRSVVLSVEPIVDYTEFPVDGDIATLTVEQHQKKVNHLICLGKGDLAKREVIHLYVDQFDRIGKTQYYTLIEEICDTYDNSNSDDLEKDGIAHLTELRSIDNAEIALPEAEGLSYDIGDIVGAKEMKTGISVTAAVSQKIVKINNGAVSTEYKTGG